MHECGRQQLSTSLGPLAIIFDFRRSWPINSSLLAHPRSPPVDPKTGPLIDEAQRAVPTPLAAFYVVAAIRSHP